MTNIGNCEDKVHVDARSKEQTCPSLYLTVAVEVRQCPARRLLWLQPNKFIKKVFLLLKKQQKSFMDWEKLKNGMRNKKNLPDKSRGMWAGAVVNAHDEPKKENKKRIIPSIVDQILLEHFADKKIVTSTQKSPEKRVTLPGCSMAEQFLTLLPGNQTSPQWTAPRSSWIHQLFQRFPRRDHGYPESTTVKRKTQI